MDESTTGFEKNYAQFADVFPEINAKATPDSRVFRTPWERVKKDDAGVGGITKKHFFACIVNGSCYGVEVFRADFNNTEKEQRQALLEVKEACDYYEEHGKWPNI